MEEVQSIILTAGARLGVLGCGVPVTAVPPHARLVVFGCFLHAHHTAIGCAALTRTSADLLLAFCVTAWKLVACVTGVDSMTPGSS